jgi:acyl-CoA synthetase (NDP forming)
MKAPSEQAARAKSLQKLFAPDSIAVVGASETFDKLGGRVLTSLVESGYKGAIYPVNPNRAVVQSRRAYSSLEAIEASVDLAVICLAASDIEAQVQLAARFDVGSLIVLASGFAEFDTEGAAMQQRIAALAKRNGMPLLGPNCLGFMNGTIGLMVTSTVSVKGRPLRPGKTGFVSQSGAIATFWMDRMFGLDLGCSKWVTTGNEADVTVSDALEYLVDDEATEIIGMYVEGFREGDILRRAFAKAIDRRKPIIVLRSGRSRAGAAATASHTGVLSGEDALYRELFDQFGVCQVNSISEMVDVSRVFLTQRPIPGKRTCVISLSGGAGALIADAAEFAKFEQPRLPEPLIARLRRHFPAYVQLGNPIDLTTQIIVDPTLFERTLEAITASGEFDTIFTFMAGRTAELLQAVGTSMAKILPRWSGNYATIWQATTVQFLDELRASGVLVFDEIPEAITAVALAVQIAQRWSEPAPQFYPQTGGSGPTQTLTEFSSKTYLKSHGMLQFPAGVLVQSADDVDGALAGSAGPWVVKLQSAQMTHKSGAGGIELNLTTVDAVRDCVTAMLQSARRRQLECEGVLIEIMEKIELEIIVGLRRDPVLGRYLLIGRGGVSVEIDGDVTHAFLPLSAPQIEGLFARLRGYALFTGHRGKAPAPMSELGRNIEGLCRFFAEREDLAEIEINPLAVCKGNRIVAIDATVYKYADDSRLSGASSGE